MCLPCLFHCVHPQVGKAIDVASDFSTKYDLGTKVCGHVSTWYYQWCNELGRIMVLNLFLFVLCRFRQMGEFLVGTGEFAVKTFQKLWDYNQENKVVEKSIAFIKEKLKAASA